MSEFNKQILYDLFTYPPLATRSQKIKESLKELTTGKQLPRMISQDLVGVEVEVEGITNPYLDDPGTLFWRLVEDGSLRNNGWEFVSIPMGGQTIPAALAWLKDHLARTNPKLDFSERTSDHVHVNVRDLSVENLYCFLLLYLVFEPLLYEYVFNSCRRNREKSIFCVPVSDGIETLDIMTLLSCLERGSKEGLLGVIYSWRKYAGLNLHPIRTQGTVEFRHMGGMLDVPLLCQWINLLLALKRASQQRDPKEVLEEIKELNTTSQYSQFLQRIFEEMSEVLTLHNLKNTLERGVTTIKTLLIRSDPKNYNKVWGNLSPKNKEEGFMNSSLKKYFELRGFDFSPERLAIRAAENKELLQTLNKEFELVSAKQAVVSAEYDRLLLEEAAILGENGLDTTRQGRLHAVADRKHVYEREKSTIDNRLFSLMDRISRVKETLSYVEPSSPPQPRSGLEWEVSINAPANPNQRLVIDQFGRRRIEAFGTEPNTWMAQQARPIRRGRS